MLCSDAAARPLTAARKTPASVLHKTQDSITRWQAAHRGDTLAQNIASLWTDERAGRVEVRRLARPRRDWLLTTEFCVTPFVPFTRFSAGSENRPACSY